MASYSKRKSRDSKHTIWASRVPWAVLKEVFAAHAAAACVKPDIPIRHSALISACSIEPCLDLLSQVPAMLGWLCTSQGMQSHAADPVLNTCIGAID